jgi:L-alanine-DL-glutamate epimerase-like enolase superfamily enzyme
MGALNKLNITEVERTWISIPHKPRHARAMSFENWGNYSTFEVVRLHTNSELVGYGENLSNYAWIGAPQEQVDRITGHSPAEFLWDDRLGLGLQMAIWDLVGKALGVPCYRLMGAKVRDRCPISWWSMDMYTEEWQADLDEAMSLGYMSAKLKARPWRDFASQIEVLAKGVPKDFRFCADFNFFLRDVTIATPYLLELEKIPSLTIFESPIPQGDVEGNRLLRRKITRPIAMHYGSPPIQTAIPDEVCDGFVIGGTIGQVFEQSHLAAQFNKPFFLELVGTGLTTAFTVHMGAVLTHATWPAITCHEIFEDDLLTARLTVRDGYAHLPEGPGLGVDLDEEAVTRYTVQPGYTPPYPRTLYRLSWASGGSVTYAAFRRNLVKGMVANGTLDDFLAGNQRPYVRGSKIEVIPDDGSADWSKLYRRAIKAPVQE